MVFKRALPIILLVASGGTALAGSFTVERFTAIATFALAALAVLVISRSTHRPLPLAPAPDETPATTTQSSIEPAARPLEREPLPTLISNESIDDLGITDPVTGMMNHLFFAGLIGTKIATARRRLWPVSIVLLHVSFSPHSSSRELENNSLAEFAKIIEATLRDADVPCRIATRTFGLILDDTDEDGAAWAAERIQLSQARRNDSVIVKVSAGIASYPSHGIEAPEILSRAREALERATSNVDLPGLGLVIVAPQRPFT
jgi:diguanylate cyclase (GGDEF)-like protein